MIVIGHKSPDTDSVVCAIVWAQIQEQLGHQATPGVAGQINNETKFVLDHFEVKVPEEIKSLKGQEVFLVDHNSFVQSPDGGDQAVFKGCLDHHLMAGPQSTEPVYLRCEPVGSTSTLVASFAFENAIELDKTQAGLLLAGLLSDTFNLTSPTTTQKDKEILAKLVQISGIDADEFATQMFEAKSSIEGMEISEIITKDYKEFEFGQTKFGFGVWETVMPEPVLAKKEEIKEALKKLKSESGLDFVFFAVVDILKQESFMILPSEPEEEIIKNVLGDNLKGLVSRKKQMIPPLGQYFEKLK